MADFKRGGFGGGDRGGSRDGGDFKRGGFGKPRFNGGGDRGGFRPSFNRDNRGEGEEREMFDATCASCGKACQVPFRPSGDRPIFCKDCFARENGDERGGDRGGRDGRREFGGRDRRDAPRTDVIRRDDSAPRAGGNDSRIDDLKRNLEQMSSKLDKLVDLMSSMALSKAVKDVAPTKGEDAPKKAEKIAKAEKTGKVDKAEKPAAKPKKKTK